MSWSDKVVLITGASSGLGKELALSLSKQGARLSLFSRRECPDVPALFIQGDVTKLSDCKKGVEETIREFGRIDYLILNAGISMWSRFDEIDDPQIFQSIMETNYLGAVYLCHYALPFLKKSRGMITAISSLQGKIGVPYHTGYTASKHALQGFLDCLRTEIDLDILIVSPSWIQGTQLKDKAIVKNSPRISRGKGLILGTCVDEILKAMQQRKRELILPKRYKAIPWLKLICPKWLDQLIISKVS
jgi:NAD(P)-dependent dehydrogenase (short-subunit alcohol dehydrogenase family)